MSKSSIIIGDLHINEQAIPELTKIVDEILSINSPDRYVQLGDFYDKNKPTPLELKFGTDVVRRLKANSKLQEVVIISGTGEHDIYHDTSVIEYLSNLGIKAVKGDYIDDDILYGHWMTNQSKYEYGSFKKTVKELKKYKRVILGHQHSYQLLAKNICHLGSVRYVNFGEVDDKEKYIGILKGQDLKLHVLKSPMPMIDVTSVKELSNIKPGLVKVRLVINSFKQFKQEVNEIHKWKHKFHTFKVQYKFEPTSDIKLQKVSKDYSVKKLENILTKGIENIEDVDVRKLLLEVYNNDS